MVVAEFAISSIAWVMVLAALVQVAVFGSTQLRTQEQARAAARLLARGDSAELAQSSVRRELSNARLRVAEASGAEGPLVTATVEARVPSLVPLPTSLRVARASATAVVEQW